MHMQRRNRCVAASLDFKEISANLRRLAQNLCKKRLGAEKTGEKTPI
jgi:hypothetical protein